MLDENLSLKDKGFYASAFLISTIWFVLENEFEPRNEFDRDSWKFNGTHINMYRGRNSD